MRCWLVLMLLTSSALADDRLNLGVASRAISRGLSASRDAAYPQWQNLPRQARMGGADVGIVQIVGERLDFRFGIMGFTEIESDDDDVPAFNFRGHNNKLWRGHYGAFVAFAFPEFAEQYLGERANMEVALSAEHESDHESDGTDERYALTSHIGDYLMPEAAARFWTGPVRMDLRTRIKLFTQLNKRSYSYGPSVEVITLWPAAKRVQPFVSHVYEHLFGDHNFNFGLPLKNPDNYHFRQLAGIVLPGKFADFALYSALAMGHGKGKLVFREQLTWGWGARVVLFGS